MIESLVRRRPARLFCAVLLSGTLLAGCGGGDEPAAQAPSSTPAPPPPAAPKGYKLVKVADHGFAIAYPTEWSRAPLDPEKLKAALKANPQLPLDPDKQVPYHFLAYNKEGSGANVNVIASSAGGADLTALEEAYPEQVKALKPEGLVLTRVQTPAGEMLRISYSTSLNSEAAGKITTKIIQYVAVRGNALFIATISQVVPNFSEKVADKIGRTLYPL